jgi:hypothetical protein
VFVVERAVTVATVASEKTAKVAAEMFTLSQSTYNKLGNTVSTRPYRPGSLNLNQTSLLTRVT